MLDPRRLRVLVELARRGSIAAAAESLSFVPSAISQQIDALERELGVELTARVGRGTALTAAGRLLADRGEDILRQLDATEEALHSLSGLDGGQLRVAAVRSLAATLLPGALAELARRHPSVQVTLLERDRSESLESLHQHDADGAVVYSYDVLNHLPELRLTQRELSAEQLVVAGSHNHRNAGARDLGLADFEREAWIVDRPGSDSHLVLLSLCREAGFEPRTVHSAGDLLVGLRLVAAGQGVALLPAPLVSDFGEAVAAVSLREHPRRTVLAAWRDGTPPAPVGAMVEILTEAGGRMDEGPEAPVGS